MALSVQRIVEEAGDAFLARHRLPRYLRSALHAWATCRTKALGIHVRRCPKGHYTGFWFNSCQHRSCPQCCWTGIVRWLRRRARWTLPCPHHHAIFTLPHVLLDLWRYNRKPMNDLLFSVVRSCLFEFLEDPRHLGAKPGVLAVLHTWGRTLSLHPHIHCLVTAGGLDEQGRWKACPRGILVPARAIGLVFRGRFLDRLERLLRADELTLPPDIDRERAFRILAEAAATKWTPRIEARYPHGRGVLSYLARYVRGGPFRNHRLVAFADGKVTFRYRNYRRPGPDGNGRTDTLTLETHEFLRRLLSHVPAPYEHTVRGWGLYAHTSWPLIEAAKDQLGTSEPQEPVLEDSRDRPVLCPVCKTPLQILRVSSAPSRLDHLARDPPTARPAA